VVTTAYGGGASVPPAPSLSSTGASKPLWDLVAAGVAVVHFGTPGIGSNRGLWYPPGHSSGRWESFRPQHDNPEKSAVWALQWTKVQALYPFDLTRVAMRGFSGGAALAVRTAMGPERARSTGSAHVRASTRVAAVLAIQPPTSAWALEQGPELTIPFPKHLEQAAQPGVAAVTLSQVAPELQKDYSLMRECFASAEARTFNASQPVCLVYGDPVLHVNGAPATFALDASGFPVLHDRIKQPLQHDSWFGYVFWKRLIGLSSEAAAFHAANSVFAMRDVYALPAPDDVHTSVYSGTVKGAQATRVGHTWLLGRLLGPPALVARCSVPARAFTSDVPLRVLGSSGAGSPSLAWVSGGAGWEPVLAVPPGARAWLLLGRAALHGVATPLGALHLDPNGPVRALALDPSGRGAGFGLADLTAGPLALQALVLDPGGRPGGRVRLSDAWTWRAGP
jgi:hypothetical protein